MKINQFNLSRVECLLVMKMDSLIIPVLYYCNNINISQMVSGIYANRYRACVFLAAGQWTSASPAVRRGLPKKPCIPLQLCTVPVNLAMRHEVQGGINDGTIIGNRAHFVKFHLCRIDENIRAQMLLSSPRVLSIGLLLYCWLPLLSCVMTSCKRRIWYHPFISLGSCFKIFP